MQKKKTKDLVRISSFHKAPAFGTNTTEMPFSVYVVGMMLTAASSQGKRVVIE
jgi:hypothetical protein